MHVPGVYVHLLQSLVVVVLIYHALTVESSMLIRMSSCGLEAHQRLPFHFELPSERYIVLEVVVVN